MYILMISRGYPTVKEPQWGCFEQDQAEALLRFGHKVVVVSVDSRFLWRFRKIGISHKVKNGVDYFNSFWIPGRLLSRFCGMGVSQWVRRRQLEKMFGMIVSQYGKPDVIYGQFFFNTYLGIFLKKKYGIPLVGIEHAGRFNQDRLDPYTLKLATYAYNYVDAVIAVSETLKARLKYHFKKDAYVVHNLVSSVFENAIRKVSTSENFQFVSTGSLVYGKGFDILINAFAASGLVAKGIKILIIGDGVEKEKLQSQISSLHLDDNIILVGQKSKDEIVKILCDSHAFILPSRSENFSVAVLEALSVGLPVIATICGGIKECINEKNGILVPVEDTQALCAALKEMYLNYSKYDMNYIMTDYQNRFSSSVIAKQLTDIFETVVSK